MDPNDNTFPIPGSPPNQGGSTTPPPNSIPNMPPAAPAANPAVPTQPGAPANPAPQQPQTQPNWMNDAAADAAAVPAGADNASLTAPTNPSVNGPAAEPANAGVAPLVPQTPAADPNVVLPATPPVDPATQAANPAPTADPSANPLVQTPGQVPVPQENTIDLSQSPQPQALPTDPNTLQPGVPVNPTPIAPAEDPVLAGLPPDFGTSYNAELTGAAAMQTKKRSGPLKFILIGVAILAVLLIISLVVVFSSRNQRKPAVEINEQSVQTQTTSESSTPASLPSGYKYVDRDCYKFGIVENTTIDFTKTNCKVAAKFGTVSQYDVAVTPSTAAVGDLNAYAASAKTGTLESQSDITLNNIAAKKLIQKVNNVTQQTIVVIPTGKNYTFENKPVTGFTITTTYNDDDSKKVSDNIVSTWTWK